MGRIETTRICGGGSLPYRYIESALGKIGDERAQELFQAAAEQFDLRRTQTGDLMTYGSGRWNGFHIEGGVVLTRTERPS